MRALANLALVAALVTCATASVEARPGAEIHQEEGGSKARAEAERFADRAKAHYDAGQYAAAVEDYRDAYRIYPSAGLLYNLGQSYRLLGDCVSATTMYRHYLRLAPRTRYRRIVMQHLADLEECAGAQTPVSASIQTGGLGEPPRVAGAWPILDQPSLQLGVDTGAAPPRARPGRKRKIAGLAIGGTGALLAGVGVYFAIDAGRAADEVSALYARGATWAEVEAVDSRGRRSEVLGGAMLGVGAAALAAGVTLYVLGRRADREAASLAVTPSRDGFDVQVSWRF